MPTLDGKLYNDKTTYVFDIEAVRKGTKSEKGLRGSTLGDIERETGVPSAQLSTFLTNKSGLGLHCLVSLAKWANLNINSLVVRKRNAVKHTPSPQEQQLRILNAYMSAAGFERDPNESAVDAAVRFLAQAKDAGLLEIDSDEE